MAGKQKETYESSTEAEDRAIRQGRMPSDKDIRTRQQRDLNRAYRMLEEDAQPGKLQSYPLEETKKRMSFMSEAMRNARQQKELDEALKANEERAKASEMQRETRGVKPTPLKDRADMAAQSYGRGIREQNPELSRTLGGMKKGGAVKKYAKGGAVKSASARADGCAKRGKTKGRMV